MSAHIRITGQIKDEEHTIIALMMTIDMMISVKIPFLFTNLEKLFKKLIPNDLTVFA